MLLESRAGKEERSIDEEAAENANPEYAEIAEDSQATRDRATGFVRASLRWRVFPCDWER